MSIVKKEVEPEMGNEGKNCRISPTLLVVQGINDGGADIINKSNTSSRSKGHLSLNPWGLYTSEKFTFSPATIMNQNVPRTINYNAMLKCIPYISQQRFGQLRLRSLVTN